MEEKEKKQEKVLQAVKAAAVDGQLTCTEARRLAAELGVEVIEVGKAADDLKVKIRACELGCF